MSTTTATTEIQIGDKVRSFDFPGRDLTGERACYVEGIVVAIAPRPRPCMDGIERYHIRITARVFGGIRKEPREILAEYRRGLALPPVNGTRQYLGNPTDGVEKIDPDAETPVAETFEGFPIGDLSAAFDAVKDPADWRAPIRARIAVADYAITAAAIEFYTATPTRTRATAADGTVEISSIGYRRGPAGDH